MTPLDYGITSFFVVFFGGLAGIVIVMFIYYFNYKYEEFLRRKQMEKEARELQENLESYGR